LVLNQLLSIIGYRAARYLLGNQERLRARWSSFRVLPAPWNSRRALSIDPTPWDRLGLALADLPKRPPPSGGGFQNAFCGVQLERRSPTLRRSR
jgi:hypothetical protein